MSEQQRQKIIMAAFTPQIDPALTTTTLESLFSFITSDDQAVSSFHAIQTLRKLVFQRLEDTTFLATIQRETSVVSKLKSFFKHEEGHEDASKLQLEASLILCFIDSEEDEKIIRILLHSISASSVAVLSRDVVEHAILGIGRLLTRIIRDKFFRLEDLENLLATNRRYDNDIKMTQSIATTISVVICFEQEVPKFADIQSAIPFLSRCLHSPDTETIIAATTSFSSITACDHQKVMEADESIAPSLIGLLVHPREDIVVPALRAVGNIIAGTDQETQRMIDLQVIPSLLWLLDYPNGRVRREALWTLSNITAGTVEHVQAVIDAGVIPKVVPLLKLADKEDEDLIKESCWLISNALASGSDDQVRYLIHENVVEAYCQLLPQGSKLSRLKLLKVIYDGLDKALRFVKDHPSYIPSVLVLFEDYEVKNGLAVLMKRGAFTYSDCFLKISKCIEDLQKIVVSDVALTESMANLTTEN